MSKNIDYYMSKEYLIEILPIPEDKGGGFWARLPELGRSAIVGDGDTIEEALLNLEKSKKERFGEYIKEGIEIPEPHPIEEQYSGKFVLRLPKILHRDLSLKAKENGVSLNQYVIYLLGTLHTKDEISEKLNVCLQDFKGEVTHWRKQVSELYYNITAFPGSSFTQNDVGKTAYIYEKKAA